MTFLFFLPLVSDVVPPTWTVLHEKASSNKREQIDNIHSIIDKKISLYSDLLVRILACRYLLTQNMDVHFIKNNQGKPYIAEYPNFHFNISHTHNAIAVAVSNAEIGIDIERLRKPELRIAYRYFAPNEVAYIEAFDSTERFYEVWTKKEAFIKWTGKGLSVSLNSFDTTEQLNLFHVWRKGDYIISIYQGETLHEVEFQEWTETELVAEAMHLIS
jgi:4'-phosphopantetheinyl transferase